jgi:hypothetical protein
MCVNTACPNTRQIYCLGSSSTLNQLPLLPFQRAATVKMSVDYSKWENLDTDSESDSNTKTRTISSSSQTNYNSANRISQPLAEESEPQHQQLFYNQRQKTTKLILELSQQRSSTISILQEHPVTRREILTRSAQRLIYCSKLLSRCSARVPR